MTIDDLLERHGAFSLEKQDALSEFLGEHRWDVELAAGTVDFGAGRVYPIQLIGTESGADGSWLWAWANTSSNVPPRLLESAHGLRRMGQRLDVKALVEPRLGEGDFDAHQFGLIACGVMGADAYYLGHHGGGAVLFLMSDERLRALLTPSALRMNTIFMTFISGWPGGNHERAFVAYAEARGCRVHTTGRHVECVHPAGDRLAADFDARGRLIEMRVDANPTQG